MNRFNRYLALTSCTLALTACSFMADTFLAPAATPEQLQADQERVANECRDIELMGLFNVDMRPMSPLIVYQAKIRNNTQVARIVTLQWLDMYGQGMQSTVQVGGGQIATVELSRNTPSDRRPIDLRLSACR